jgi:hypothetical protein
MKYTKNNIIINFLKGQGLGNQLWVLFSGIQISRILNCNVRFGNGKFFKGFFLIKDHLIENKFITTKAIFKIDDQFETFSNLEITNYENIINSLKKLLLSSDLELIGSLQNTNFLPARNEILNILKINQLIQANECIIHIRGGDYKNTIVKVSKIYLLAATRFFKRYTSNFKVITDDKKYANKLLPDFEIKISSPDNFDKLTNEHHYNIGIKEDFISLVNSKYNILSASTFGFWACYIGSLFFKKKIIAPAYWFANRVSDSWSSPTNCYIKNWLYMNKKGEFIEVENGKLPNFISKKPQNRYLNFFYRKILNLYLNTK